MPQIRPPAGRSTREYARKAALVTAACMASLPAWAGSPRVSTAFPAVAQRGTEQEVTFAGTNLADARTVLFDAPGFEVTSVKAEATRFVAKIRVPADAELGEHRCRVVTESGIADLRLFFVSPFPVIEEATPKTPARIQLLQAARARVAALKAAEAAKAAAAAAPAPAGNAAPVAAAPAPAAAAPAKPAVPAQAGGPSDPQVLELNTTVFGQTQGEDQDWFAVNLEKGQRLSIEVVGLQLQTQTPYDPEVILKKPDGSVFKTVSGTTFGRGNPAFSVEAPEAGRYVFVVRDSTRNGTGLSHYIMHVGDFPRPVAALPGGGPAGKQTEFTLLGDPKGPIKVKTSPGLEPDTIGGLFPASTVSSPSAVYARVSDLPNILEGGSQATAPALASGPVTPLPAAFNGVLNAEKQKDFFRFSAKKGQAYEFNVYGRALRSPIDSVLYIYDAKGNQVATNDDNGTPDSYLKWTAPADAEYIVGIKDQLDRGGPLFTYRIEAATTSRKVKMWLPEMTLNSSQDRRAVVVPQGNRYATLVRIKREDWAGPVRLEPVNLPANVQASSGTIDKTVDTVAMVFEAAADAPLTERLISMTGSPAEAVEGEAPQFKVEHSVSPNENGNQKAYYTVKERYLALSVAAPIPATVDVVQPTVPAIRAGQFPLKIKVTRKDDFKGPLEVSLLHAPTGIATAGSVKIPAESNEGTLNLSISGDAPLKEWNLCVVANADFGKGATWFSSGLFRLEVAEAPFAGSLVRTSIPQGGTSQMKLKLEQKNAFEGKAKVELLGLPNGVSAEPLEVDAETKEVTFALTAKPEASLGIQKQVTAQFTVLKNGVSLTANCAGGGVVRVDRPDPSAKPAAIAVANAAPEQKPAASAPAPTGAVPTPAPAPSPAAPTPPAAKPAAPAPAAPAPAAPAPTAPAPATPNPSPAPSK